MDENREVEKEMPKPGQMPAFKLAPPRDVSKDKVKPITQPPDKKAP